MPNHVMNVLEFSGDAGKIREMREKIKNDKFGLGTIDFEKIIPILRSRISGLIRSLSSSLTTLVIMTDKPVVKQA